MHTYLEISYEVKFRDIFTLRDGSQNIYLYNTRHTPPAPHYNKMAQSNKDQSI